MEHPPQPTLDSLAEIDRLLAPNVVPVIEAIRAANQSTVDPATLPLAEARARYEDVQRGWRPTLPSDVAIERFSIPCAPSDLSAVRIVPAQTRELVGQMLYLHGGGWVFGSIDTHLSPMAHLAARTGLEVIGINYRLAPEFPFPDALNDSLAAWRSLSSTWPGAPSLRFIGGDSVGANLAVGLMLSLRNAGSTLPDAALLFYGAYAADEETLSHRTFGDGSYGLSSSRMAWFRKLYLERSLPPVAVTDPLVAPLHADLRGLPPLFVLSAQCDVLCTEGDLFAQRAKEAGVSVQDSIQPGLIHGFLQMVGIVPEVMTAIDEAAAFVRSQRRAPSHSG